MKFSDDAIAKYYKGSMITKISPLDRDIKFEPLDMVAVAKFNERVSYSIKQANAIQSSDIKGMEEVFKDWNEYDLKNKLTKIELSL